MWRLTDPGHALDRLPPDLAWQLVATLFDQRASLVMGGITFGSLGMIAFAGTGSLWYLAGGAAAVLVCLGRLRLGQSYARTRGEASPGEWARRVAALTWATGAIWGGWSAAVLFERNMPLVILVVGVQSGCVIAGAVRNCAVPKIAIGQSLLALLPLVLCASFENSVYMNTYAAFTLMSFAAVMSLTRSLNSQMIQLLRVNQEKSALVARLETAGEELEVANQHLATLAATDGLTGVANRRSFDLSLTREWRRAAREEQPLSLLMLDVDHFKAFNDLYGHQAGDLCLQDVAAAIGSALRRPGDMLARFGGEEFAVILPATYADGARRLAENVLATIAAQAISHQGSAFGHVTVSIGVACLIPRSEQEAHLLTARADAALYVAKRGGRNRVQLVETDDVPERFTEIVTHSRA